MPVAYPAITASLPYLTLGMGRFIFCAMNKRILYIAAYDICNARRLREALHVLRGYASGGQKSVFECFLTEAEKRALLEEIRAVMDESEDRFLLLRLDPRSRVEIMGIAVEPIDPQFYYVG